MKTIRLPANCEFVSFDTDVGRLISIAEYPDNGMLDARMKHDWRIGASLLDAVREGRLRVRDYQTRFPLKPDAPSVAVLPSLVSVNDFREFVADLGYSVQVGDKLASTVTEHNNNLAKLVPATPAAPAIPESEALPALAANSASKATVMHKSGSGFTHSAKARRDTLTPVIELAKKQCLNPQDTPEVWAALLVLAEKRHAPLLGATEDGLQYLKNGAVANFKRDSLRKRLNR